MKASAYRTTAAWAVVSANLILISCSGESGPQPGTPAFFWAAARQTFAAADYGKTIEHLDKIVASENEYTARARPLLLILTSGMARGYGELVDRFEAGARANKADPGSFRKNMNFYRAQASRFSLHFAQAFGEFQKSKDETVPLAFSYPTGSANPPLVLTKVANGISASGNDVETAQKQNIERAVLLTTCASAGAPDDPAKTQEVLKQPDTKVPRAVFVTAMANALYDQSQLFGRQKLD